MVDLKVGCNRKSEVCVANDNKDGCIVCAWLNLIKHISTPDIILTSSFYSSQKQLDSLFFFLNFPKCEPEYFGLDKEKKIQIIWYSKTV